MTSRTRRWREQRWLVDTVIATIGIDWDQPRSIYGSLPGGARAVSEFARIAKRIGRLADFEPEFQLAGEDHEKEADRLREEGDNLAAREAYFIASLSYGMAQWASFTVPTNDRSLNEKKLRCYSAYAQLADHEIRRVEIPMGDVSLPGWLHLPEIRDQERVPVVLSIRGMDGHKELTVSLVGDRLLARGIAVLAIDGPGQAEALTRGIHCSATNWFDAGRVLLDFLRSQSCIDGDRIILHGISMGSFWATQVAALDGQVLGCVVQAVCHEPGLDHLFNYASPTYKERFMFMAGYDDEVAFDRMAAQFDLREVADQVRTPYLAIAGEHDELSPIEHTYNLLDLMNGPTESLVYEGARHALTGAASVVNGPDVSSVVARFIDDRLSGQPMVTERRMVNRFGVIDSLTDD